MKHLLISIVLFSCSNAVAQEIFAPAQHKLRTVATSISKNLKLDGQLNEPEWRQANIVNAFVQVEPYQGSASDFRTEVRVLFNKKFLYVGVYCADPNGKKTLRAPDLKRDFEWRSHDTFAVCFDGFNDNRNSIAFATNPFEAQKDYLSFDDIFFDGNWNGLWRVRTTRSDSGWVAEMEIPWKTMRYPEVKDSIRSWGVNFLRLRRQSNEISVWSGYPRSFGFNRMEYAGKLDSLVAPPPSANIQFNPYFLLSRHTEKIGDELTNQSKTKLGGELKWALNSNNILDLTLNTDFAQADADIQVNNLSRFSVLFPERRQFFLENASLFSPGLTGGTGGSMNIFPFFSRTIGLDPSGNPISIDGGARYVHRSSSKNFGALVMRQAETNQSPISHFAVARYSQNIAKQNRIGAIASLKTTTSDSSYTNHVVGVDGFFRFSERHSLNAMVIRSDNSTTSTSGYAGYAQYFYTSNLIQAYLTESFVKKSYKNETGFVSRNDVISTSPGFITNIRSKWLPFKKWVRAIQPDAMAEFYHQASTGKLIESSIVIYPMWVLLHSGGYFGYSITPTRQNILENFTPLGLLIEPGQYRYNRSSVYAGTDASKKLSATVQYDFGNYFNGELKTTNATLSYSPIPHINVKASIYRNDFKAIGSEEASPSISLYTVQGRFAANPRIQITGLFQYNTYTESNSYNVRLSWEYRPLNYLFVVFNHRDYTGLDRKYEQDGIVKISYLKQF